MDILLTMKGALDAQVTEADKAGLDEWKIGGGHNKIRLMIFQGVNVQSSQTN